jgi:hypothetical protein
MSGAVEITLREFTDAFVASVLRVIDAAGQQVIFAWLGIMRTAADAGMAPEMRCMTKVALEHSRAFFGDAR